MRKKTTLVNIQWQTKEIIRKIIRKWLRRGNLKKENEPLLIVAHNYAIRTSFVKVITNNTRRIASVGYMVTKMKKSII